MSFKSYQKFTSKKAQATANKNAEVNTIEAEKHEKSKLDLSYSHKTTFDAGVLVPVGYWEVLPGDVVDLDISMLVKMSIPNAPTMDNPRIDINAFFVPWFEVWKNWKNFEGTQYEAGAPISAEQVPTLNYGNGLGNELVNSYSWGTVKYPENSVWSYFNLPCNIEVKDWNFNFNVLPFRAYVKIWNDWYRDENLDEIADYQNNGNPDQGTPTADYISVADNQAAAIIRAQYGFELLQVNRLRDYFSSCLPFIQKGQEINIASLNMNEIINSITLNPTTITNQPTTENEDLDQETVPTSQLFSPNWFGENGGMWADNTYPLYTNGNNGTTTGASATLSDAATGYLALQTSGTVNGKPVLQYDGTGNTTFNITDLRAALVKQHFNELMARGGDRYFERLLTLWGVKLNPLEIDRSELIGGFHQQIQINNIVQTAPATTEEPNAPIGSLKALSITTGQNPQHMTYAVEQPGIIIVCACVRSNLAYSQGIPKLFSKYNAWDFYNPEMNGISEQPIYTYELYANNVTTTSNGTTTITPPDFTQIFGYNQPYADLKYKVNVASGYLSTLATDTYYNFYTYQNNLSSAPTLSNEWMYYPASAIQNTLLLDASNKSENINDFLADFYFKCKIERTIPAYSIPGVDKI